jgi:hypothetical protein
MVLLHGRKAFFFEKKKQKTFYHVLASAYPVRCGSAIQKFFASFFQKRSAFPR